MTDRKKRPAVQMRARQRLRAVEELYLAGYGPQEIHDLIGESYGVTYGTLRNDIVRIRAAWGSDIDASTEFEGRHRYLAALRQLRRKVMSGWEEDGKKRGRDYALAYRIDQDIARLSGVRLKGDERTIHLDVQAARGFIDRLLEEVFAVVKDPALCEEIVARLERVAADGAAGSPGEGD